MQVITAAAALAFLGLIPTITAGPISIRAPTEVWKPTVGTTWAIQLIDPVTNLDQNVAVYDFDLFDNDAATISALHSRGKKVICYFSAGSYEEWRDDAGEFEESDLGNPLEGWDGERWLDTNSANVRRIMSARMDVAVQKNCDAIDPDNIDAYDNDNGLGLTETDAINYVQWMAGQAHSRNLAIGLKNGASIVTSVLDDVEFQVNEQCVEEKECAEFRPFITAGKPVFHIEYPEGAPNVPQDVVDAICNDPQRQDFSTLLKTMDLDEWAIACPVA